MPAISGKASIASCGWSHRSGSVRSKLIYLVAVVFFVQALICALVVVSVVVQSIWNKSPEATAVTVGVTVCAACYGVYLLIREYRVARWLMYAMTAYIAFVMFRGPAAGSPFDSEARIQVNRIVMMLPMIASCIYLALRQ